MVLDIGEMLVVTDFFVIATGASDTQVRAIAEEVERRIKEETGIKPIGREGEREREWVLLDYGPVVVHIFQPEIRDFYRLETLWDDGRRVELPESITGPVEVRDSL